MASEERPAGPPMGGRGWAIVDILWSEKDFDWRLAGAEFAGGIEFTIDREQWIAELAVTLRDVTALAGFDQYGRKTALRPTTQARSSCVGAEARRKVRAPLGPCL